MPRPRTTRRQAQAFLVSPWMSQHPTSHQESPWYQVVEVPGLVVHQQADSHPPQQQQQQQKELQEEEATQAAASQQQPAKRPCAASDDGWVTARRPRASQQAPHSSNTGPHDSAAAAGAAAAAAAQRMQPNTVTTATEAASPHRSTSSGSTESTSWTTPGPPPADTATHSSSSWGLTPPPQPRPSIISGTARLVLLPSGDFTGHLVEEGSRRCWGLVGRQVLAQNNCYRGTDWSLLKVTLIPYAAGASASAAPAASVSSGPSPVAAGTVPSAAAAGSSVCSPPPDHLHEVAACATSSGDRDALSMAPCSTAATAEQQAAGRQDAERGTGSPSQHAPSSSIDLATDAAEQQQPQHEEHDSPSSSDAGGIATDPSEEGGAMQLEAWVQRTGGDLFKLLPADMEDEDTAAVVLEDNLGLEPCCPQVEFVGHQLVAGGAAGAALARAYPGLQREQWQECVVNVGPMVIKQLPRSCMI